MQPTSSAAGGQLELSISLSDNARTRPILDGHVSPQGIRLIPTMLHPSEMFWRQLHFEEFDISEMSFSSLLISASRGDYRWAALPIFTMRKFFHTSILVRRGAGIETPTDLKRKKIGVPEYQQTWAVWSRGILQEEFGVEPSDMTWFMERGADRSHGAATGFKAPPGVVVHQVPPETNLGQMLEEGQIDATLLYLNEANLVDRSRIDLSRSPKVRTLFADPMAEGRRYYAKTGLYPINHVLVVRRSLLERHPWIALNLMAAFNEAKDQARHEARAALGPYIDLAGDTASLDMTLQRDPMAYGFKANRPVLGTLARYLHQQGLAPSLPDIESVFARSVVET